MFALMFTSISLPSLTVKFGDPGDPMTPVETGLTVLLTVGVLYLLYLLGRWAHRDAVARKCSGGWAVFLVIFITFPIGLIIWLGLRPPIPEFSVPLADRRLR